MQDRAPPDQGRLGCTQQCPQTEPPATAHPGWAGSCQHGHFPRGIKPQGPSRAHWRTPMSTQDLSPQGGPPESSQAPPEPADHVGPPESSQHASSPHTLLPSPHRPHLNPGAHRQPPRKSSSSCHARMESLELTPAPSEPLRSRHHPPSPTWSPPKSTKARALPSPHGPPMCCPIRGRLCAQHLPRPGAPAGSSPPSTSTCTHTTARSSPSQQADSGSNVGLGQAWLGPLPRHRPMGWRSRPPAADTAARGHYCGGELGQADTCPKQGTWLHPYAGQRLHGANPLTPIRLTFTRWQDRNACGTQAHASRTPDHSSTQTTDSFSFAKT